MIKNCLNCRRSKKRCSKNKPKCSRCIDLNLICDYSPIKLNAKGEERVQFDRQRVRVLGKRLNQLFNMAKNLNLIDYQLNTEELLTPKDEDPDLALLNQLQLTPVVNFSDKYIKISGEANTKKLVPNLSMLVPKDSSTVKDKEAIKKIEIEYIKLNIQSLKEMIILNNSFNFNFKIQNSLSLDNFKNDISKLFIDLHMDFYPFITEEHISYEKEKEKQGVPSPLLTVISLKVLRHSKYVYLRDSGVINFDKNWNKTPTQQFNNQELPLLFEDPLYLKCKEILNQSPFQLCFEDQLRFIQANLLLLSMEFINMGQALAYNRIMEITKLSQMIHLNEIALSNKRLDNHPMGLIQFYEVKTIQAIIILYDLLISCFINKPSIFNNTSKDDLKMIELPIEWKQSVNLSKEELLAEKRMKNCCKLTKTISILHICNKLSHLYTNQEISLQNYERIILLNINQLNQLYAFDDELIIKQLMAVNMNNQQDNNNSSDSSGSSSDTNSEETINNNNNNSYPLPMSDYLLVLIKNTLLIDLVEPIMDAFVVSQINSPKLTYYQTTCLKSCQNIIQLLDYRQYEIYTGSRHPYWGIREASDWTIPMAAFHALKAVVKCRNLNLLDQDLKVLSLPLREIYKREAPQFPICSSKLDFARYHAWECEFINNTKYQIKPATIGFKNLCGNGCKD
ncbi:hypothetical protein K502DRAFT_362403 [Neoconidiobolus thromboides FSU 785]|nr:hypothetical protein K502DRAFT_362403 [Neoconidiobolus thromboides FSU 785]